MASTDQYNEIILIEDEELVGLRFCVPDSGIPGVEVNLFIDKHDGLDEDTLPLVSRLVQ